MEIMLVVFIIGLVSGVLVLRVGTAWRLNQVEMTAKQLNGYLNVVQQQAILQPGVLGVVFTGQAYQAMKFDLYAGNVWQPLDQNQKFWHVRNLPKKVTMQLQVEGKQANLSRNVTEPQLVFFSSGEQRPFVIQLQEGSKTYQLRGNFAGQIDLIEGQLR